MSFFGDLKTAVLGKVAQFKNEQFAKSTMAACAFMADASNGIDPKEEESTAEAIGNLDTLKVFDPTYLQGFFTHHVEDLRKNRTFGKQNCLTEVAKLKAHPDQAQALVVVAIEIGSQDPDGEGLNFKAGQKLIHTLGLNESDFDLSGLKK